MDVRSVRSGSDFYAGERSEESWRQSGTSVSIFSALLGSEGANSALMSSEQNHAQGYGYGYDDILRYRERDSRRSGKQRAEGDDDDDGNASDDSQGTEIAKEDGQRHRNASRREPSGATGGTSTKRQNNSAIVDEVGGQDAFVAGMIYALSRRLLPGGPYSPGLAGMADEVTGRPGEDKQRWRLDECLRYGSHHRIPVSFYL